MSNLARSLRVLVYTWLTLIGLNHASAVEAPVRIMPLGDSITFGQAEPNVEGGYRDRLYTLLTSAGFNVDFVGTFSDTTNPELPDKNHQGAPGYRVDEINASIGGWLDAVDDPDVILIQIGTNDFLQVDRNETSSSVLAKLDALITNIATRRPFAKIVVSTLILSTYTPPAPYQNVNVEAKQVAYNQGIPNLVAQHVALGRQVSMVDLHPTLTASDLYDTVHPKTTGYNKMADAWLPGVVNVIAPKGTSNAPHIARTETPNDLTKLSVTFSKPVADASTALSNFSISGGLTVSTASLDPVTKRTITLTTSTQTPGEIYTLTVNGVRDRTTLQKIIAPQSKAMFYPNLLSNGSFESSYTGWPTHTGNQEIKDKTTNSPYTTPEGNKMVAFNTGDQSPNAVLTQSFSTTVGQAYRLTYNLGVASWQYNWTQKLDVNIQGSNSRLDTTSTITGTGGAGGAPAVFWFPWSHDFTANSTTTTLTFADASVASQSYSKDMMLDNVKILRAGSGTSLAVTSTPNAGAIVTISQNDLGGNGNGTTGLIRSYSTGTTVTVTAPLSAAGRTFQKWQLNGADISLVNTPNRAVTVTLNSNTTLNALYDSSGTILPVAVADSYTTNEDTQLVVAAPGLLLNDSDANALPLTALIDTTPSKGNLTLNANGSFTYMPNPNSNGADSFTYRVYNGSQYSSPTTVPLTLTPVNDPPVAVNNGTAGSPFLTVAEDSGLSSVMIVLTNDSDPDGDNLIITNATSSNGAVSIVDSNKNLRFTPAANFNGATTISYTISDGNGGTANAIVYITVTSVNDPPVAVNNGSAGSPFLTVVEDSGLSATMTVLTNDSDPDGDNLTITSASSSNGSVSIVDSNKNLRFTPAANFSGATTISYTVSDGNGGTATATVYITVTPVNDPPVAVNNGSAGSPFLTVVEDSGLSAAMTVLTNDSDPDGDNLTITSASSSNGSVNIVDSNKNLRFTPAANFSGATTISYTISDGNGGTANATVYITVTAVNDAPVANAQSVSLNEDGSVAIILTGSDVENSTLTFAKANPSNGTLTGTPPNLTYTPDANYSGSDNFTFTVNDGSLTSTSATVSITVNPVNDPPVANAQSVSVNEDNSLAILLTGSDVEGSGLTFARISPGHGTLTGTAPNLTYTPAPNYFGPDTFTFTVSDGSLTSPAATVSITVNSVNDTPVATPQSVSVNEDGTLAITLTGSDVENSSLAFANVSPSHGVLTGTAPALTYTPAENYFGPDSFTFTVSDGTLTSTPATISITVSPVNDPPAATADSYSTAEDTPLTVAAQGVLGNDADAEGTSLTAVLVTNVTSGTLALAANGGFTYTPASNFSGGDSFTYKTYDGVLNSNIVTVTLTVTPINDPPVAIAQSVSLSEDSPLAITLTGSDAENSTLSYAKTSPSHGTLTGTAPGLTYTPAANYFGTDSFTFTVNDGVVTSAPATISITVNAVNDAPVATADSYSTNEDTLLTVSPSGVLGNDTDPEGTTLTAVLVTNVANGTLALAANGGFTYTPGTNFHGADSFTYKAYDGTLNSNTVTVTLTINPVNDPPVAAANSYSTNEDTLLTVTASGVLGNDTDPEGTTLTAVLVTDVTNGTLALAANGGFTYTPGTNFHGADSFTYKAYDGALNSNIVTATLTIAPVNDPPVAIAQSVSLNEDGSLSINLTGDDVENTSLSFAKGSCSHGALTGTAPNLTYTPAANYFGPDSFTFTVSDGALTSTPATVAINVDPVNDPPEAAAQSFSLNEDSSLAITLAGSDVENSSLNFFGSTCSHGALTGTAPNLTYTPAANYSGPDSFTFTVSDGALTSTPATISITVNPVNDAPEATADSYSTDEDTPLTVTAPGVLGNDTDPEGTTLTAIPVTNVTNGTLALAANGGFTYTPPANFSGEDSFTYKVHDGALNSDLVTVTLTINPINDRPVAIAQSVSLNEDGTLAITLAGSDVENSSLSFAKTPPTHGTLTGTTPNLTYAPAADYFGPDTFAFTVSDGSTTSTPASVSITVNPVNDPPLAVDDGSIETPTLTITEDSGASAPLAVLANDSDVDLDTLTVTAASSPNGTVTINGDGTLTFTPAANFSGPTTILHTISDGKGGTASATAHVLVTAVNDAPIAMADSYATDEDTVLTVSPGVLSNDSDQENSILGATLILSVTHGTLDLAPDGSFTYTPEANFNGGDSFTYRASDGDLNSSVVTVTITVAPINDVPVALPSSIAVDEDHSVNTTLTGSDVEGSPLAFSIATQPVHGSVTLSGAVATYTPLPDYHGPDSFTFTASDGVAASTTAAVSVVVNPLDEFNQWLEGSSQAGGPNDDPDGDSISNALEFVLGGSPGQASPGDILPTATLVTANVGENLGAGEYLLYTYRRSHLSQIDPTTSVQVEWATSLAGPWTTADGSHDEVIATEAGDPVDMIKVYIPRSAEGDGMLFTRLKVVLNLPPDSPPPVDE